MVDDIFSINGKVVNITGGGRGLGHNLANGLATRSAITYSLDKKFTNKFQKNLLPNITEIKCDITNPKRVAKVFKKIFMKEKRIDVLINNAGINRAAKKNIRILQ